MGNFLSQCFFIPKPTLTEHNCPDQKGRVFIVTGGYAGVGFELVRILASAGATVYIAGRSPTKASSAISKINQSSPSGQVKFLQLDLSDLPTIKPAVELFLKSESRLDVLVNNAGVMFPPPGSLSAQSHDLQLSTNCLGPLLLHSLLRPLLEFTAAKSPTASVRVAWACSVGSEVYAPRPGGMKLNAEGAPELDAVDVKANYAQTKVGNAFFAKEFARREGTGVVHVAFNPGNLRTELFRHWRGVEAWVSDLLMLYDPIYGAYTELWAVLAEEVTPARNGAYIWPWGRFGGLRSDVEEAARPESEGGRGLARKFVEWCERETLQYM